MKALIITGIVLIIAAITNPGKEQHMDAVKGLLMETMSEKMIGEMDSNNDLKTTGAALGYTLGMGIIEKMIDSFVHSRSFVLFSLTEVSFKGESRIIGVGAFGNVWIFKELDRSLLQQ